MRRLVLVAICALWLLVPGLASGYDLLIVQSQRATAYDEVLRGLRSVARFSERVVILSDYSESDLLRIAREEHPLAIVTLGDKALEAARKVRQTPVVALMSLKFRGSSSNQQYLTGVEVQAAPERYLPLFSAHRVRRIGVVASAVNSGAYLRHARRSASGFGIELVVREVHTAREVATQLETLAGGVDALWMLPDPISAGSEAADAHFIFSAAHKVPVITFSSAYLTSGAAIALDSDRFEMGRQGGEMVSTLMTGAGVSATPPVTPRKTTTSNNPQVLRRLGLRPELSGMRGGE